MAWQRPTRRAGGICSACTALWPTTGVRQFGPRTPITGEKSVKAKTRTKASRPVSFAAGVGRALRRAAQDARKTARMYGTPLYVWENGKVVAKKP